MCNQSRGVSPVISTIMMVAIVVILSATVSVFMFDVGEDVPSVAPNVAQSSGEFVAGSGDDDQVVSITHLGGDTVDIESIEIVLRVPEQNEYIRLVDLPGEGFFDYTLDDSNIQGSTDLSDNTDVIDQGPTASNVNQGPIYKDANDRQWNAGETIAIEVAVAWDFRTSEYNELDVLVIHTESESILIEKHLSP
jgi:flagellin-like protein